MVGGMYQLYLFSPLDRGFVVLLGVGVGGISNGVYFGISFGVVAYTLGQ